jgi:hypothetical protein
VFWIRRSLGRNGVLCDDVLRFCVSVCRGFLGCGFVLREHFEHGVGEFALGSVRTFNMDF